MWPRLTGEQFFAVLRRNGWTLIIDDDFWWAYRNQGAISVKLLFVQETILVPSRVALLAERLNLTLSDF